MRRREFVTLVGGAAAASCAGPFAAFAQAPAKRPRIVYLGASLPGPAAKTTAAFIEGMGALGYTEATTSRWNIGGPKDTWSVCPRSRKNWCGEEPT